MPCNLEINTADRHHTMKPCGQIGNLGLIFPGRTETTPLQSVLVLPNLNGDVNLGYKFLQQNQGQLSFDSLQGRPSLHLPRLQSVTPGPILLQLGTKEDPPRTRTILGMDASLQHIPISLSKPVLVEAGTFRRVKVTFKGLAQGTSLYLSRQYIGEVHTVEGVYNCSRGYSKKDMIFYLGFINTSEQDITLFPSLQGLFVSASTEQGD